MSVYVDDMKAHHRQMVMCHMLADTDKELRKMAQKIGVPLTWHQGDHFDICLSKKAMAIKSGAIQITQRQAAAMNCRRRHTGSLGSPDDAEAWLREHIRQKFKPV